VKNIAIFASGTGTNAKKMIEYFEDVDDISVRLVVSNRVKAPVLDLARSHGIDTLLLDRDEFYHSTRTLGQLRKAGIDYIVLAGFLWLIPDYLVEAFAGKMINIHPALLPKYGGKGMYGMRVHREVAEAGEKQTGITIHHVNEAYDEGKVVFQAVCEIAPEDTPEEIARKVQHLEHRYFAPVVEKIIRDEPVEFC